MDTILSTVIFICIGSFGVWVKGLYDRKQALDQREEYLENKKKALEDREKAFERREWDILNKEKFYLRFFKGLIHTFGTGFAYQDAFRLYPERMDVDEEQFHRRLRSLCTQANNGGIRDKEYWDAVRRQKDEIISAGYHLPSRGYVYCFINDAMPGVVKIGRTNDISRRLTQLSTALPKPFEVVLSFPSQRVIEDECLIHYLLKPYRIIPSVSGKSGTEFFAVSVELVKDVFISLHGKYVRNFLPCLHVSTETDEYMKIMHEYYIKKHIEIREVVIKDFASFFEAHKNERPSSVDLAAMR